MVVITMPIFVLNIGIFPSVIEEKNTYYNRVRNHIFAGTNRARLGLTGVTQVDDMDTLVTGEWKDNFELSSDSSTATSVTRKKRDDAGKLIEEKLRFIYDEIPGSALTTEDRAKFNLKVRDSVPSDRSKIETVPYCKITNRGNGRLTVRARTNSDSSRASVHPESDGLRIYYGFFGNGEAPPVSLAQLPQQKVSSTAKFDIETGTENLGRRLYAFAQWVNNGDESKNGPLTDVLSTVIGGSPEE